VSGNVGVGAQPAPSVRLNVSSPFGTVPFSFTQNAPASSSPTLALFSTSEGPIGQYAAATNAGVNTFLMGATASNNFGLFANNSYASPQLFIKNNGNVGIGTTNPTGGQLDVVGAINASTQYNLGGLKMLNAPGLNNTYAGLGAGAAHTTGFNNAFFGTNAGLSNTSGFRNAFFGSETGTANTTGMVNSFFGDSAGMSNTIGVYNSFFGYSSGAFTTTGNYNTFIGGTAGYTNATGTHNTALGYRAYVAWPDLTNATAIGARAYVTQSNSLILGSIDGQNTATEDTDVGIGTTAPQARLHVAGGPILVSSNAAGALRIGERHRDNSIIAWGTIGPAGATLEGFGVTSVTNDSAGVYTVTLAVSALDNPSLVPVANAEVGAQPTSAADARLVTIDQIGLTQFKVYITTGAFAAVNNKFTFIVTGR
jgi:hypothetical protein